MVTLSIDPSAADFPTSRLRTRAEAEAYVATVCFKTGPPRLHGIELEWTVHHDDDPSRPLDPEVLISALGPHAPPSLVPGSPHRPLPNGSSLTVEPGGQVEVSSLPSPSVRSLFDVVAADADHLRRLLRPSGLSLGEQGTDPWRHPRRVLQVPRYAAMESAFDRIGIDGRLMMCSTAGVQVCLDAGEPHRIAPRWAALHALGPVMLATFANSPKLFGHDTGWLSTRTRAVLRTDPPRTRPGPVSPDPATGWARRMLDTALVCLRRDGVDWTVPGGISFAEWISGALAGPPTMDDLDYHMSTVFPPVRARGYLEVRYLDAQPGDDWMLPAAALIALFEAESTVDEVLRLTARTPGRWMHAARHGLADPVLASTAEAVFGLALRRMDHVDCPPDLPGRLSAHVARRVAGNRDRRL
ncbi:glutamate--cysteine ligase [Saccharopolyspora erythraea NRRL 2338]|uniref:Glutamate--cysteine ligase EgtA n=2 Tax=Saccharopolyspora erythraea TaxID=1836 RepID=A4FGC2_SACEN|nr:ergothioneine biosynthesis glutamate--cysteine ligase EgtA [Saccharopolyspora erythraea]PFG96801.1 glutamate--cysteine ligase [Saccharopolyspora erythraea NRRL 2338]CAM03097.1 glutamate-cysteine ligase [Saccharopolyspora erythraea NRRL 2338]